MRNPATVLLETVAQKQYIAARQGKQLFINNTLL